MQVGGLVGVTVGVAVGAGNGAARFKASVILRKALRAEFPYCNVGRVEASGTLSKLTEEQNGFV